METRIEIAAPLQDVDTARLHLRRFREDDLDALEVVFAKPEVWMFPYGRGLTRTETEAFLRTQIIDWAANGFGCWLALEKPSQRPVGYLGLSIPAFLPEVLPAVEVGWRLDPDVWGRGYATEGASKALEEGFERLGLEEICSIPQSGNPASEAVCRRLGMRWGRSVDIPTNSKRGPLKAEFYALTRSEWRRVRVGDRLNDPR